MADSALSAGPRLGGATRRGLLAAALVVGTFVIGATGPIGIGITLAVIIIWALVMVAAGGVSYEDAAKISGVAIGTVKSRVARARAALAVLLNGDTVLPDRLPMGGPNPADDILAQLSAVMPHTPAGVSLAV